LFIRKFNKKSFFALLLGSTLAFTVSYKASAATVGRVAGSDRYKTAIEVSKNGWKGTSDYAIIATGSHFADALCAAPLTKKYNAPILLVDGNSLSSEVSEELTRLKAKNVFITGGTGVVSKSIENQLSANYNVIRLAGADRYETSIKIAEYLGTSNKIVLASGDDFPDALSIASIAAKEGMPILLSEKNTVSSSVDKYLSNKTIDTTYIVGGEGVISSSVAGKFKGVKRLAGVDRFSTNIAVMNEFQGIMNFDSVYVASSANFPDALAGSALASKTASPILLTANDIPFCVRKFINSKLDIISTITILGGTGVVSDTIANRIGTEMYRVAIDAGHGEIDSGAVGPTGLKEKDVNLAIALKLGKELEDRGIDVVFTRTTDNVSWVQDIYDAKKDLQARCDIANAANVDLFISIHNNAFNGSAHGTETYYALSNTSGKVFADAIQAELVKATNTINRGVKTAEYYVLKNTKVPAVLTEVAFIDNPAEEKLLASYDFQVKSARAIATAIDNILKQ